MSLVSVQSVSHLYVGTDHAVTWALRAVNLELSKGTFTCIVGPSGCGKTTLLQLIAGFVEPTFGEVRLNSEPIRGPGPDRSVVFQEYALFAWMTARQNIEFGLRATGMPKAERHKRSNELLAIMKLEAAADKYPHELSGGMRQRVAVARGLAIRPAVLLMDEPFAAVDAITRMTLQEELLRLWRELGLSILFITHNVDEAIYLSNQVVVMSAHPGTVKEIMSIDFPHPRDRGSAIFAKWYARISSSMHQSERAAPAVGAA
jgi:NitT/TauT family transport system ATP-binding protein